MKLQIRIKNDAVEIEGYVNAVERNSKPLNSRIGRFIERICKGAFKRALARNDDVHILLNHDWTRDLGSTKRGNLELAEDTIGLHARARIDDPDVVRKARNGSLVGWSFGFTDEDVENRTEDGLPLRLVRDLDLYEVSILDNTKTPAYDGTLITTRDDETIQMQGEPMIAESVNVVDETDETQPTETAEEPTEVATRETPAIDYSKYEQMINEMRG